MALIAPLSANHFAASAAPALAFHKGRNPLEPFRSTTSSPLLLLFQQTFHTPEVFGDTLKSRTGFVARVRPERLGVSIFPLQTPSTHIGSVAQGEPVTFLYQDDKSFVPEAGRGMAIGFRDDLGVENKLWTVADTGKVRRLLSSIMKQPLVLVQGRSQYEAALATNQEWITATFINANDPGLVFLPCHRVVRNKPDFKTGILVMNSRAYFFFHEVTRTMPRLDGDGPHFDLVRASELLLPDKVDGLGCSTVTAEEAGALISPGSAHNSIVRPEDIVMLAVTRKQTFRLHSQPGWADHVLAHIPDTQRNIDVVQLQKIILEGVLELPAEELFDGKYVTYHRDPIEAVREVRRGADVAFIMSAPKVPQLFALAQSGGVLPHNSIAIYPPIDSTAIYAL